MVAAPARHDGDRDALDTADHVICNSEATRHSAERWIIESARQWRITAWLSRSSPSRRASRLPRRLRSPPSAGETLQEVQCLVRALR